MGWGVEFRPYYEGFFFFLMSNSFECKGERITVLNCSHFYLKSHFSPSVMDRCAHSRWETIIWIGSSGSQSPLLVFWIIKLVFI